MRVRPPPNTTRLDPKASENLLTRPLTRENPPSKIAPTEVRASSTPGQHARFQRSLSLTPQAKIPSARYGRAYRRPAIGRLGWRPPTTTRVPSFCSEAKKITEVEKNKKQEQKTTNTSGLSREKCMNLFWGGPAPGERPPRPQVTAANDSRKRGALARRAVVKAPSS